MARHNVKSKVARKKYAGLRIVKRNKVMRSRSNAHANCSNCGMVWERGELIDGMGECCDKYA